jgi:hypothetical protein
MDGLCRIGVGYSLGEGVLCCFLLVQSALLHVVLTKCEEHERVTLDTDENPVRLKGTKLQAKALRRVNSKSLFAGYCKWTG